MAVIYLFDSRKKPKRPVKDVVEIIHKEGEYTATAEVSARERTEYGDHFGFKCADGRFRLFWINAVEKSDEAGTVSLTGFDASLAELNSKVLPGLSLKGTTTLAAAEAALSGTGWQIGRADKDAEINMKDAYFETRWAVLRNIAAVGGVRVVPYYEFAGGEIVGRKIDLIDKTPVFRGMILTRHKGAQNIHVFKEGTPFGRVYPVGKIIGSGDPPEQVTIAGAAWSTASGDPADKPAGQMWVDLPGAITDAEYVFEDKREEDPQKLLEKGFADLQKTAKPKASGTATIGDVEHVPGYEHRAVRMWDLLPVRTEDGELVESTVINIARYHVHRELTKITIGEEDDTEADLESLLANMDQLLAETVKAAGGAGAGAGEAKTMILNAEELIQLNSKRIEANAEEIQLRAYEAHVVELENRTEVEFQEVYLDIDKNRAEISATEQNVNNLENTVQGINSTLTVQAGQIAAKASQYELDQLGNRVTTAESTLTVQAGQIESRVRKDGVISSINQTAEAVKIKAGKIDLDGYVTASAFSAEIAAIENIFAGRANADYLYVNHSVGAQTGQFTNISLINYDCEWKSGNFVTSVTFPVYQENTIYYTNSNGSADQMRVLTPTKRTNGSYSRSDNYHYLGRKSD